MDISKPAPATGVEPADDDLAHIYHALKIGHGHERVNDGNVQALILMAVEYGDSLVETLLREWHSSCGEANSTPAPGSTRLRPATRRS